LEVTVFFQLLWLLCGLGSATFAASVRGWKDVCLLALGLVATVILLRAQPLPDPPLLGGIAAVLAGWRLARPRIQPLLPLFAGVLAATMVLALRTQEVAWPLAALAAAPAVVSATLAWRQGRFAPESMRDEALLLIIALGLVTALAPGLADGWQSATGLSAQENPNGSPAVPVWVLWMTALSAAAGGAFTMWRRS
jgi:hypothetical protein